ncbi:MAG TPA: cellulase family glycosylhydrolase, partial [Patescibacteria group bacterium]
MPSVLKSKQKTNNIKSKLSRYKHLLVLVFVAVILLISTNILKSIHSNSFADTQASTVTCNKAVGPFTQKGAKIFQADGKQFIPYGITVYGLAGSDYQIQQATVAAQINAAAAAWCSNIVRLQVAPKNLIGSNGTTYSQTFMDAINSAVSIAEKNNMVVVISAQTEKIGQVKQPVASTAQFWKDITNVYGNDPQVIFDLFNEPRLQTGNITTDWQIWQKGAFYSGTMYLGMQTLADDVRSYGAKNLLWIEGPEGAGTLDQVGSYPIKGANPFMYAIHHPVGSHDSTTWDSDFGYLVKNGIAPVVDGEWTNYASSTQSECWPDAPTTVSA